MPSITAHCLVKNEEVFIESAIRSVLDFVNQVIVFDTGSTDQTVAIITNLQREYPHKIVFEKKGEADKTRHTALRQEMVDRTTTDWWMILDGDEVWPKRTISEANQIISTRANIDCVITPFYLCVGDAYHATRRAPQIEMFGRREYWYPRFFRTVPGQQWRGDYNQDTVYTAAGLVFFNEANTAVQVNRYWHMTHLRRSSVDDADYSSGGTRANKRIETYVLVGKKINESIPETLTGALAKRQAVGVALEQLARLIIRKVRQ